MSNNQNKRYLGRVSTLESNLYTVKCIYKGRNFEGKIIDFNSVGLGVRVPENIGLTPSENGELEAFIYYGKKAIAHIRNARIARSDLSNNFIALAYSNFKTNNDDREQRLLIKEKMRPLILAQNPVRTGDFLHFQVTNLSPKGLRLTTSLSNKQLMVGMELINTQLFLPGSGVIHINIKIVNLNLFTDEMSLGCEIQNITKELSEKLGLFTIYGVKHNNVKNLPKILKQHKLSLKHIAKGFRLQHIDSASQYEEVLKIRRSAYTAVGKIDKNSKQEELSDEYDKHSLVYLAYVDNMGIATVRLVYNEGEQYRFPLEEHVTFPDKKLPLPKSDYFEVSRLAVLPGFQGSDLTTRIFQLVAQEVIAYKKTAICTTTNHLKPIYLKLGAVDINVNYPHPTLTDETMNILILKPENFISGKSMPATVWDRVAKDPINILKNHGVIKPPNRYFLVRQRAQLFLETQLLKLLKIKKPFMRKIKKLLGLR